MKDFLYIYYYQVAEYNCSNKINIKNIKKDIIAS